MPISQGHKWCFQIQVSQRERVSYLLCGGQIFAGLKQKTWDAKSPSNGQTKVLCLAVSLQMCRGLLFQKIQKSSGKCWGRKNRFLHPKIRSWCFNDCVWFLFQIMSYKRSHKLCILSRFNSYSRDTLQLILFSSSGENFLSLLHEICF